MIKKVLIIGSIWPYHRGAARLPGLAKYLAEFGWEPVVLTQPLPDNADLGFQVVEAPYRDISSSILQRFGFNPKQSIKKQVNRKLGITAKKSFTDFIFLRLQEILAYPDGNKGWKSPAIKAGSRLLKNEGIRAIISISPPIMSNIIARKLKVKYGIPWIADFPHLWSQNNGYPYSPLRRFLDRRLELKTLSKADRLVTINQPLAAEFSRLHQRKTIHAISHGFDLDTLNIPPARLTDKFTITYTGSFSPSIKEPTKLFIALRKLIEDGVIDPERIGVRLFGPPEIWIDADIESYGLSGIAKQYGIVPQEVAFARQRESQLLLVPKDEQVEQTGMLSLKFFEYLAARRPILAIGGHKDIVDEKLKETGAGRVATTDEEITQTLGELYREYRQNGQLAYQANEQNVGKYSQRRMAEEFAQVLDDIT
jgi:glycosyltransferase involved in cell wall biosynthesis